MNVSGTKNSTVEPSSFHQNLLSQALAELRKQYSASHKLDDVYNFQNVQFDEFWDDLVAKLTELMYKTNQY